MALILSKTTLFYHDLRTSATCAPSIPYPNTKSTIGIISNWADHVAVAARSTPSLSYSSSQSWVGLDHNPPVSESHGTSPSTDSQPGGFEPKIKDDILPNLEPEHKATIAKMPVMSFSFASCSY
jgi:hypothetical protein